MAIRPFRDEPDIYTHKGFLLSEDESLKDYLSGIQVPGRDSGSKIDVGVWFRWPEGERQIKYPFIAIDLLSANPEFNLFTSDYYQRDTQYLYEPSKATSLPPPPLGWGVQDYALRNFWPFTLTYQVAVHCRSALHDRYLQSIFRSDVFPPRPFWITNVADGTWRRTEMTNAVASDLSETTESGTKRIFRKIYTVTMLAEVPQDRIADSIAHSALRVLIPVTDLEALDRYFTVRHEGIDVPAAQ